MNPIAKQMMDRLEGYSQVAVFEELLGHTMVKVYTGHDTLIFTRDDGRMFCLAHQQNCCESVFIESIVGDLSDLVGVPLTQAEEVSMHQEPDALSNGDESYTWTFYKFASRKGCVDVRFYGSSNGYYSESVSFSEVV